MTRSKEFEQKVPIESEKKYLPIFPEKLMEFREASLPIEQFYLSHPSEPFSLRFREVSNEDGSIKYTATLKDRGTLSADGLERLEVEIEVSPELYTYYKSSDVPVIKKLRAQVNNHVTIDFLEDGRIIAESEHPTAWTAFIDNHTDHFVDITGDKQADNEWNAHYLYRKNHGGNETLQPLPEVRSTDIVNDILASYRDQETTVIRIIGRSGSGKSTIVKEVQDTLRTYGLTSEVISTDDYHRGTRWLVEHNNGARWTEWDHPIVYDTQMMANEVDRLLQGDSITRQSFDFVTAEPIYCGTIDPTPVVIIEGIYARAPELSTLATLDYDISTPVATSIGRRLLRDLRERPEFADPENSLRYMLEQAEPMWRNQGKL